MCRTKPATISTALVLAMFGQLTGCGSVKVFPAASGFKTEPKPTNCHVDFLLHAPEVPYDEIAELARYLPYAEKPNAYPGGAEPQDVLRQKACELGADAVIVTRDTLIPHIDGSDSKLVAGIAIKYRDRTGKNPQPPDS